MKKIIIIMSILLLSNSSENLKYCDIKGNIKNPGVYEIKSNTTIKDIIDKAGGLTKNAYTDNINLSKIVKDEMVIYIFSKTEIEEETKKCVCEPIYIFSECQNDKEIFIEEVETNEIETTTKKEEITQPIITEEIKILVNINFGLIEDLVKLEGLGEKKAIAIIEYREKNGLFDTIEDILKVDGIGKVTFEKIKDYIEV